MTPTQLPCVTLCDAYHSILHSLCHVTVPFAASVTVCCMRRWASIPEWEAYSLSEIARRSHLPWVRVLLCLGASIEILFCPEILPYFSNMVTASTAARLAPPILKSSQVRQFVLHLSLFAMLSVHLPLCMQDVGVAPFAVLMFGLHSKTSGLPALMYR